MCMCYTRIVQVHILCVHVLLRWVALEAFLIPSGKLCFLVLRQQYHTIQAVLSVSDKVSKQMVRFAAE